MEINEEIIKRAELLSEDFLTNDSEYRLGFIESEQPNPITAHFGEACRRDTLEGVNTLIRADRAAAEVFAKALRGNDYGIFAEEIKSALSAGGRIIISGCGSSGRLAMRLEASWREAFQALKTDKIGVLTPDSVVSIMTGGDFAVIRAVESFEDHTSLGYKQAADLSVSQKDILVGVTATGETTSVLGTAMAALDAGARVWMVVCTDPRTIYGRLRRADAVYKNPLCRSLYMNCGGMAVTGSTRMQSSTLEQAAIGCALEEAFSSALNGSSCPRERLALGLKQALDGIESLSGRIADCVDTEAALYGRGGHITYFANEFLLDVLADTTERGPTFCTPPFRPQGAVGEPLSWAFVKNPLFDTKSAWEKCFCRVPRCLENYDYAALGIKGSVPPIGLKELYAFEIGNEKDEERESGESLALWLGESAPAEFYEAAKRYKAQKVMSFNFDTEKTHLKLFEHLGAKMLINNFSTCVMAKNGRIYGNYMVCMSITNKKLVDRATRIVASLCNISYEEANKQIFIGKLLDEGASPVKSALQRLTGASFS